jgi:hypothetical protein
MRTRKRGVAIKTPSYDIPCYDTFCYDRPLSGSEIRLLSLVQFPRTARSILKCKFQIVQFTSTGSNCEGPSQAIHEYDALSYVWEETPGNSRISAMAVWSLSLGVLGSPCRRFGLTTTMLLFGQMRFASIPIEL